MIFQNLPVITGKFSPFTENLLLPVNEILYRTIITNCDQLRQKSCKGIYYMSLQYCNKSKSQLTSPTPAQAASCCVISGTYSIALIVDSIHSLRMFLASKNFFYFYLRYVLMHSTFEVPETCRLTFVATFVECR
jgi:hypothetical protein